MNLVFLCLILLFFFILLENEELIQTFFAEVPAKTNFWVWDGLPKTFTFCSLARQFFFRATVSKKTMTKPPKPRFAFFPYLSHCTDCPKIIFC